MKKNRKKRIGIDARLYGPVGRGLGRYIQELVDHLIEIDGFNEYVIFLRKENYEELILKGRKNVKKVLADIPWYGWKEQILMPFYIWREKLDLIHFPHFNIPFFCPSKFLVTIHDLILTEHKSIKASTRHPLIYEIKNFFYKIIIKRALKKSKKIITVSNFTKNDIVKKFKIDPRKIVVTYEGVSDLNKKNDSFFLSNLEDRKTLDSIGVVEPFLLYVGSAYPHKNLEFLIKAFKKIHLNWPQLKLVLLGRKDYFYQDLETYSQQLFPKNSPIIFGGYLSDAELKIIYQKAWFYIFPSLYEGFGLPPLEAMAASCPVLSSNLSSLPEILGTAAFYFNPRDEADLVSKIDFLMKNQGERERLIKLGQKQQQKYNWLDCAQETWKVYSQVL